MINTWMSSDSHFGHSKILEFEPEARPFSTVEEMNETLIDRWNSAVKPNDIVFHLGDFAFGKKNISIAGRLNGKKKLILGNHDTYPSEEYLKYFEKLYGMIFWHQCVLSHMPVHSEGLGSRWLLSVHGHLHSKKVMRERTWDGSFVGFQYQEDPNYFNVSVERHNLTPVHADIILERCKKL